MDPSDSVLQQALQAVVDALTAEATTPAQQADARAASAATQALLRRYATGQTRTRTIAVGPTDSLWTLAAAIYGDARLYWALVELNSLDDPRLWPGQSLIVPAT